MDPLFHQTPSPEAQWVVETLRASVPASVDEASIFHSASQLLRDHPPTEHPLYGTSLLLWQRIQARLGDRAEEVAKEAFLQSYRAGDYVTGFTARILELWLWSVPLRFDLSTVLAVVPTRIGQEWELLGEDLALGAFEGGVPSEAILQRIAQHAGHHTNEARAIAQVERFTRGLASESELLTALVPAKRGPEGNAVPHLTERLCGTDGFPRGYTPPLTPALSAVVDALRLRAASEPKTGSFAEAAWAIIRACTELRAAEVLALAQPGRAAEATPEHRLPPIDDLVAPLTDGDAEQAVRVAWKFPSLAGVAEVAGNLPGLTSWVAARAFGVPDLVGSYPRPDSKRARQWEDWTGAPQPKVEAPNPITHLLRHLRTGQPLATAKVLGWLREGRWGVERVLFDSPRGPGLLDATGQLGNHLATWPAPDSLLVVHPLDLPDAERLAWQGRLLALGPTPISQVFREHTRVLAREKAKTRLERGLGSHLGQAGVAFLARQGWFPLIAPAERAPELDLGEVCARLLLERDGEEWKMLGAELLAKGSLLTLADAPPRAFSELWRDLDEARSLSDREPAWRSSPARAELVRALEPQLGLGPLRVEPDHVAGREGRAASLRITLANAVPTGDELLAEKEARSLARSIIPFVDDGGVAALLLGRLLHRAKG